MGDYLIGVQARMEDAALLADAGRYEGALLMMLVALSATSRRCYPEIKPAGEAFKKFIEERNRHFTGLEEALRKVNWPGSVADFLWKTLRCNLEHEGQLDEEQHPHRPGVLVTLTGNKSNGVGLTPLMLWSIEKAVTRCWANQWPAVKDEVCARHPEQGEEPTAHSRTFRPNSTDFVDYLKERVERIDFFLKWYPTDRRATEALESEKAELEEQIRQA